MIVILRAKPESRETIKMKRPVTSQWFCMVLSTSNVEVVDLRKDYRLAYATGDGFGSRPVNDVATSLLHSVHRLVKVYGDAVLFQEGDYA